jgi:hypothetical protein
MYTTYRWFSSNDLFDESFNVAESWPDAPSEAREAAVYGGEIYSQMIMGNLVHTSTVLLTRERFEKVRRFNEDLRLSGEDYDFHLRTCREGRVGFVNAASIQYQTGMSDRLTRPEYSIHIARNFLKTISPAIERDRDRIKLPAWMIRHVFYDAHSWIGEAALTLGDRSTARRHLFKSLMIEPWHGRAAWLLALSLLPGWFFALGLEAYRSMKRILAPRPAASPVNANGK